MDHLDHGPRRLAPDPDSKSSSGYFVASASDDGSRVISLISKVAVACSASGSSSWCLSWRRDLPLVSGGSSVSTAPVINLLRLVSPLLFVFPSPLLSLAADDDDEGLIVASARRLLLSSSSAKPRLVIPSRPNPIRSESGVRISNSTMAFVSAAV